MPFKVKGEPRFDKSGKDISHYEQVETYVQCHYCEKTKGTFVRLGDRGSGFYAHESCLRSV